jgi:superfamily II DNA or RNA helicase
MTVSDSLGDALAGMRFTLPLRRYQRLALEAFERHRADGGKRSYLVLPPGAGKTVLGLEVARQLGKRSLCLCPNTSVRTQWVAQWSGFQPASVTMGSDSALSNPFTALTYQSLCSLDSEHAEVEEHALDLWRRAVAQHDGLPPDQADASIDRLRQVDGPAYREQMAHYREQARALLMQGGSSEDLLALLHRNGRAIVERARETGPITLVLDECHHLLELWGYLVRAVIEYLGPQTFVVGLTATPPDQLSGREAALYESIFGQADFSVPTPAVVKEGDLAPYQELAYFVQPMEQEARYIAAQQERFQAFVSRLLDPDFASCSLVDWLRRRVVERRAASGATVSWASFEREHAALAQAALRFLNQYRLELPRGARLTERFRQPMAAEDWVALVEDFSLGFLRTSSDARDHEQAWNEIRAGLPSLGYTLTVRGVRSSVTPVDRVLALSGSKAVAATEILRVEHAALGAQLRALVLCDFERASTEGGGALPGVLDPQAGSALLVLRTLLSDPSCAELNPMLVTARTVACSRATAASLSDWIVDQLPELREAFAAQLPTAEGWDELVLLDADHPLWRPRTYVPLLTRAFEDGQLQCLIGTRALLGEGWDAHRTNVLVDLTAAATTVAVHQMRGRTLRLDPNIPRKVGDNWDVVCVASDHPKGANDYARFVRKHDRYFAPTVEGEIESGVSHVHHVLSPFGPPQTELFGSVNSSMTERVQDRTGAYTRWAVGAPYENLQIQTVRLRFGKGLGLPGTAILRHADAASGSPIRPHLLGIAGATVGAATAGLLGGISVGFDPLLLAAAGAASAVVAGVGVSGSALSKSLAELGPSDALEDLAAAVADALQATGGLRTELGGGNVRVMLQDDGFYRCYLNGGTREESALFADSVDELLAPLASPRYIIPRYIAPEAPRTPFGAFALVLHWSTRGRVSNRVVYHAVPAYLAANKSRVEAFEAAWQRRVSPGRALYYQDPRAAGILEVQRGANPFDATSQMRTLWQ